MATGDPTTVNEGDLAFARSVQDLADIFMGVKATSVRFTRWGHLTIPSVKIANRVAGGPILELVAEDLVTTVMLVDKTGIRSTKVNGYFDFKYLSVAPAAPGVGTQTIRMYPRNGQFYFKAEGSGEQQIPVGAPPGPTMRYAWWMAG